jgi:hypothetical protein
LQTTKTKFKTITTRKINVAAKACSISASYLGGRRLKYRPEICYPEIFRDLSSAPRGKYRGSILN